MDKTPYDDEIAPLSRQRSLSPPDMNLYGALVSQRIGYRRAVADALAASVPAEAALTSAEIYPGCWDSRQVAVAQLAKAARFYEAKYQVLVSASNDARIRMRRCQELLRSQGGNWMMLDTIALESALAALEEHDTQD